MTLQEIKNAVDKGEKVYWMQTNYEVRKWEDGEYVITCLNNDHSVGLASKDGVTMNGIEEDFFQNPEGLDKSKPCKICNIKPIDRHMSVHCWDCGIPYLKQKLGWK